MSEQLSAPEAREHAQAGFDIHKDLRSEMIQAHRDLGESSTELGHLATAAHDQIHNYQVNDPGFRPEPKMADTLTRRTGSVTDPGYRKENYVLGKKLEATERFVSGDKRRLETAQGIMQAEAAVQAQDVKENLGAYQQAAAEDAEAAGKKPNL